MSAHIALDGLWHLFPRIPLTRFLHFPWSLKTTDPAPHRPNIYVILTRRASQTSMNMNQTGVFYIKKFKHCSLPSANIHNIRYFAQLLCCTHVPDWSIDDPGEAWLWSYLAVDNLKIKLKHYFRTDLPSNHSSFTFFTFGPLILPAYIWFMSHEKGRLSYIFNLHTTQFETEACHLGKNARITYLHWISVKTM